MTFRLTFVPFESGITFKAWKITAGMMRAVFGMGVRLADTAMGQALRKLYRDKWETAKLNTLLCHPTTEEGILKGKPRATITDAWDKDLQTFGPRRQKHLLYK